jgi:hypothetical protein
MKALSPVQKRYENDDSSSGWSGAGKGSQTARVYGGVTRSQPAPQESQESEESQESMGQVVQLSPAAAAAAPADASTAGDSQAEDKPGFFRRLGKGIWGGVKKGGALAWDGVSGAYGLGLGAVHGVANLATTAVGAVGQGAEWLGDKLGADKSGPAGWVGKGVSGVGSGLQGGAGGVREFFGLDQDGNDFTGHVDIPRDSDEHTQQYSELGLPMTEDAWAMQNAIDGGKLAEEYDRTLLSSLQAGGVLQRLVRDGVIKADSIPESFDELDPAEFERLITAIKQELGSGRAFLDSLKPEEREEFQEQVIHNYMGRAKNDENAAFMLELMPTDTTGMPGQMLEATGDALIRGQGANDFKVGETVGKIRQGAVSMADSLRARGDNVYALPVPYANTVPNIIGRTGKPSDGADHMHNYLEHLGPDMTTVATGYSQGGAAVMDYLDRYGDQDGLDYALALAPMGGTDQHGGNGVYSGEMNGVSTLSIMNQRDPAQGIHGDYLVDLIDPMLTFVSEGKQQQRGLDGSLHSGFYGDPDHPLPEGVDPLEAMAAGTMGYPTQYVEPMLDDLFGGRYSDTPYARRGDWNFDLRDELVQNGQNGKLDPNRLKREGREVADQYAP